MSLELDIKQNSSAAASDLNKFTTALDKATKSTADFTKTAESNNDKFGKNIKADKKVVDELSKSLNLTKKESEKLFSVMSKGQTAVVSADGKVIASQKGVLNSLKGSNSEMRKLVGLQSEVSKGFAIKTLGKSPTRKLAKEVQEDSKDITAANGEISDSFMDVAKSIGAAAAVFAGISFVDMLTDTNNRLKSVTESTDGFNEAMSLTKRIARDTGESLGTVASLYSRLTIGGKALGASQLQVARATETVIKGLKLGGSSAGEAQAAAMQLGQALASGRFQGDELRSVIENSSYFATELAHALGMGVDEMRAMGEAGELSTEKTMRGILLAQKTINARFADMDKTFSQVFTNFATAGTIAVNAVFKALGFNKLLNGLFNFSKSLVDMANLFEYTIIKMKLSVIEVALSIYESFHNAFGGIEDTVTSTYTTVMSVFDRLKPRIIDAKKYFVNFEAVSDGISKFVTAVERSFFWLYDKVIGHSWIPDLVTGITEWFSDLLGDPLRMITKFASIVGSIFKNMWMNTLDGFSTLYGKIRNLTSRFGPNTVKHERGEDIQTRFTDSADYQKQIARGQRKMVTMPDGSQIGVMKDARQGAAYGRKPPTAAELNAEAKASSKSKLTGIDLSAGRDMFDGVGPAFKKAMRKTGKFIESAFEDITGSIESGGKKMIKALKSLWDGITSGLMKFWKYLSTLPFIGKAVGAVDKFVRDDPRKDDKHNSFAYKTMNLIPKDFQMSVASSITLAVIAGFTTAFSGGGIIKAGVMAIAAMVAGGLATGFDKGLPTVAVGLMGIVAYVTKSIPLTIASTLASFALPVFSKKVMDPEAITSGIQSAVDLILRGFNAGVKKIFGDGLFGDSMSETLGTLAKIALLFSKGREVAAGIAAKIATVGIGAGVGASRSFEGALEQKRLTRGQGAAKAITGVTAEKSKDILSVTADTNKILADLANKNKSGLQGKIPGLAGFQDASKKDQDAIIAKVQNANFKAQLVEVQKNNLRLSTLTQEMKVLEGKQQRLTESNDRLTKSVEKIKEASAEARAKTREAFVGGSSVVGGAAGAFAGNNIAQDINEKFELKGSAAVAVQAAGLLIGQTIGATFAGLTATAIASVSGRIWDSTVEMSKKFGEFLSKHGEKLKEWSTNLLKGMAKFSMDFLKGLGAGIGKIASSPMGKGLIDTAIVFAIVMLIVHIDKIPDLLKKGFEWLDENTEWIQNAAITFGEYFLKVMVTVGDIFMIIFKKIGAWLGKLIIDMLPDALKPGKASTDKKTMDAYIASTDSERNSKFKQATDYSGAGENSAKLAKLELAQYDMDRVKDIAEFAKSSNIEYKDMANILKLNGDALKKALEAVTPEVKAAAELERARMSAIDKKRISDEKAISNGIKREAERRVNGKQADNDFGFDSRLSATLKREAAVSSATASKRSIAMGSPLVMAPGSAGTAYGPGSSGVESAKVAATTVADKFAQLVDHFVSKGETLANAQIYAASAYKESGLNPNAENTEKGSHAGLFQFSEEYQKKYFDKYGKSLKTAGWQAQADYMLEVTRGMKGLSEVLGDKSKSDWDKMFAFTDKFENPGNNKKESEDRMSILNSFRGVDTEGKSPELGDRLSISGSMLMDLFKSGDIGKIMSGLMPIGSYAISGKEPGAESGGFFGSEPGEEGPAKPSASNAWGSGLDNILGFEMPEAPDGAGLFTAMQGYIKATADAVEEAGKSLEGSLSRMDVEGATKALNDMIPKELGYKFKDFGETLTDGGKKVVDSLATQYKAQLAYDDAMRTGTGVQKKMTEAYLATAKAGTAAAIAIDKEAKIKAKAEAEQNEFNKGRYFGSDVRTQAQAEGKKFGDTVQSSFQDGLSQVLQGKMNGKEFWKKISGDFVTGFMNNFANGLTGAIFGNTPIGATLEKFGSSLNLAGRAPGYSPSVRRQSERSASQLPDAFNLEKLKKPQWAIDQNEADAKEDADKAAAYNESLLTQGAVDKTQANVEKTFSDDSMWGRIGNSVEDALKSLWKGITDLWDSVFGTKKDTGKDAAKTVSDAVGEKAITTPSVAVSGATVNVSGTSMPGTTTAGAIAEAGGTPSGTPVAGPGGVYSRPIGAMEKLFGSSESSKVTSPTVGVMASDANTGGAAPVGKGIADAIGVAYQDPAVKDAFSTGTGGLYESIPQDSGIMSSFTSSMSGLWDSVKGMFGGGESGGGAAAGGGSGGGIGIGGWAGLAMAAYGTYSASESRKKSQRKAEGGPIAGPGTGTSDSVPIMASHGEFIVNASATSKSRALLEAINDGRVAKFAAGGVVDGYMGNTPASITNAAGSNAARINASKNTQVNLQVTGDVSRQTRKQIMEMLPQIASGVNNRNREDNFKYHK